MRGTAKTDNTNKKAAPCLVKFTDQEKRWMRKAMKLSCEFMKTYGKGREPFSIDKSHYLPGITTDNNE